MNAQEDMSESDSSKDEENVQRRALSERQGEKAVRPTTSKIGYAQRRRQMKFGEENDSDANSDDANTKKKANDIPADDGKHSDLEVEEVGKTVAPKMGYGQKRKQKKAENENDGEADKPDSSEYNTPIEKSSTARKQIAHRFSAGKESPTPKNDDGKPSSSSSDVSSPKVPGRYAARNRKRERR